MVAFYDKQLGENSSFSFLYTLDDLGQACYTSMHACLTHGLNDSDGHDLSQLSSECFEDGEHKGYLSRKEEFYIREANFRKKAKDVSLETVGIHGIRISCLFTVDTSDTD